MDRAGWQEMSKRWLKAGKALLLAKCWPAAYSVTGYALEFGLKSCLLVHVGAKPEAIFEDRKFSDKAWTHSIVDLVKLAKLEPDLAAQSATNPLFGQNWTVAKEWNERSRYQAANHRKAKKLFKAITDKKDGVMQWIKARW